MFGGQFTVIEFEVEILQTSFCGTKRDFTFTKIFIGAFFRFCFIELAPATT